MEIKKEFFDNFEKLQNFKSKPKLNDFFEIIYKLEKIETEIKINPQKSKQDSAKLIKQAQDLARKLEINRDEFAMRTKTQKEFEAVYKCIDCLGEHFNSLN